MRTLMLSITIAVLYVVSGCGRGVAVTSDNGKDTAPQAQASDSASPGQVATDQSQDSAQDEISTERDVEAFAVRLEQIFAGSSYPKDLAGVLAAARTSGVHLSTDDSIAGYKYDPSDTEFQLCVQNKSGAYAIYDTHPMSVQSSGDSGGCPFG